MIINHNMNAMNAHRNMMGNVSKAGKSMEKLSSGLRINRAGDDAAGLAISEKMRAQVRGLDQASRNAQDGISMIQTAEGALNETHSILQRMRELSVQAGNDTNTDEDRGQIQKEINQLTSEINRIGNTTEFNTQKLLDGSKVEEVKTATSATQTFDLTKAAQGDTITIGDKTYELTDGTGAGTGNTEVDISGAGNADDIASAVATAAGTTAPTGASVAADGSTLKVTATAAGKDGNKIKTSATGNVAAGGATLEGGADVGDKVLVSGKEFSATLQIGANKGQAFTVKIKDMRAVALGISGTKGTDATSGAKFTAEEGVTNGTDDTDEEAALDVSSHDNATAAVEVLNEAINKVSTERSGLGASQNRLEHTINNLGTASENLQAAESRIRDVDMASEMMTFSKNNILQQAAQAMLAQANQQPQGVLQLLR